MKLLPVVSFPILSFNESNSFLKATFDSERSVSAISRTSCADAERATRERKVRKRKARLEHPHLIEPY